MEIAPGSFLGLETRLLIIKDSEIANRPDTDKLIEMLHKVQSMINSFITIPKAKGQKLTAKSK